MLTAGGTPDLTDTTQRNIMTIAIASSLFLEGSNGDDAPLRGRTEISPTLARVMNGAAAPLSLIAFHKVKQGSSPRYFHPCD